MTYVVTDACIKCKYMDCVEVCPVDCFYEGENMLVIHPDECIDCGVCEPECPPEAILPDSEGDLTLNGSRSIPNMPRNGPTSPARVKRTGGCRRAQGRGRQVREILLPESGQPATARTKALSERGFQIRSLRLARRDHVCRSTPEHRAMRFARVHGLCASHSPGMRD